MGFVSRRDAEAQRIERNTPLRLCVSAGNKKGTTMIKILQGDITTLAVDAIVNAAVYQHILDLG